ncbi:MAG: class I SAM-dependent methyltransferase [Deltaproteobacteria bacterium]|nr:class I SAM-dependent methyltransferase [Deltaproteobacteria bacterium]
MLNELMKYCGQPELYTQGTAFMWTDAHIAKQLLAVHLNGDVDLASRRSSTIDSTVTWILDKAPRRRLDILDMGCGPGLYAERLAKAGHRVTGVDVSENSTAYARTLAAKERIDVSFRTQDYLALSDESAFDLVILIYTDLGVLLPEARETVLENVYRALRPGGIFIFDVLNVLHREQKVTPKNWEVCPTGFWRDHPYVALSESYLYPKQNVILYQHTVGDSDSVDVYRFWTHLFSDDAIFKIVKKAGFSSCECHTDVLPENDAWSGENVTFCVAVK